MDDATAGGTVVLTGAIRPFEMKRSDALQNLTEAIFATGLLAPGVYCVAAYVDDPEAGHVGHHLRRHIRPTHYQKTSGGTLH